MQRLYPEITVELEERSDKERCLIIRVNGVNVANAFFTKDKSHTSYHGEWTNREVRFIEPTRGSCEVRILVMARMYDIIDNPDVLYRFLAGHGFIDTQEGKKLYQNYGLKQLELDRDFDFDLWNKERNAKLKKILRRKEVVA